MSNLLSSVPQPPHTQATFGSAPKVGLALVHNRDEGKPGLYLPTPPLAYQQQSADPDTRDTPTNSPSSIFMRPLTNDPLPTPPARFISA